MRGKRQKKTEKGVNVLFGFTCMYVGSVRCPSFGRAPANCNAFPTAKFVIWKNTLINVVFIAQHDAGIPRRLTFHITTPHVFENSSNQLHLTERSATLAGKRVSLIAVKTGLEALNAGVKYLLR